MPFKEKAPPLKGPKAEHKEHADRFLAHEDHRDPKKVNKPEYVDMTDEVKDY